MTSDRFAIFQMPRSGLVYSEPQDPNHSSSPAKTPCGSEALLKQLKERLKRNRIPKKPGSKLKGEEMHNLSPYYSGNNPINYIDISGGCGAASDVVAGKITGAIEGDMLDRFRGVCGGCPSEQVGYCIDCMVGAATAAGLVNASEGHTIFTVVRKKCGEWSQDAKGTGYNDGGWTLRPPRRKK